MHVTRVRDAPRTAALTARSSRRAAQAGTAPLGGHPGADHGAHPPPTTYLPPGLARAGSARIRRRKSARALPLPQRPRLQERGPGLGVRARRRRRRRDALPGPPSPVETQPGGCAEPATADRAPPCAGAPGLTSGRGGKCKGRGGTWAPHPARSSPALRASRAVTSGGRLGAAAPTWIPRKAASGPALSAFSPPRPRC